MGTLLCVNYRDNSSVRHRRSQGGEGVQVHPQGDEKMFSRHFCWNEAKMGLNLVRCTPPMKVVGGSTCI